MIISYIASSGNVYSLTTGIITRAANYLAWTFEPEATKLIYGERVSVFKKDATVYKTNLIFRGSITHRKAVITALHDDFERDIRNLTPGRLVFGNWYCDCYITASSTQPSESMDSWTENEISIYVPSGFWVHEESKSFESQRPESTGFLKYPYGYDYDYTPPEVTTDTWASDSPFPSSFRMEIHGPCVNPSVLINGYTYLVWATIASGETLVIDSTNNTVMCGDNNLFDARNKEYSVFEPIPPGNLTLEWGDFDFDLTLYEERSEPKW